MGNFLFKKEKIGDKRNVVLLGFIKFSYKRKSKNRFSLRGSLRGGGAKTNG